MNYLLLVLLILVQQFSTHCSEDNFEGIIVYHRMVDSQLNAKETYYFSKCRLRIDAEFYLNDGNQKFSSIYNFNEDLENSWRLDEGQVKYEKKPLNMNSLKSSKVFNDTASILEQNTQKIMHSYEFPFVEGTTTNTVQYFWIAEDLKFEIKPNPNNTPYMLPFGEGKIALRLHEVGTNEYFDKDYSYERIAVDIQHLALDDELFSID